MKKNMCRFLVALMLLTMTQVGISRANEPTSVVINEIAWAGSADSSGDEWIELYNFSDQAVNMTGWQLLDDDVVIHTFENVLITAGEYFLIEDNEDAVPTLTADLILGLSLANSGDSLKLLDADGMVADVVNGGSGAWFAGDSVSKATMERISASADGDIAENWATSESLTGTPGALNSVSEPAKTATVSMALLEPAVQGEVATVLVSVSDVTNLVSYEADLIYDPGLLDYQGVTQDIFLSDNGQVSTAFYSGLENGSTGKLIVAEAQLETDSGVNGSGDLFSVDFTVAGNSEISFGGDSFLANSSVDIGAVFENLIINVTLETPTQVLNLQTSLGESRYSGLLTWDSAGSGADHYKILRESQLGDFVQLGTTSQLEFLDDAFIIPNHEFNYQVITVIGDQESDPVSAIFTETRGLKGDNNRSDRVDGRDLQNLAKLYTATIDDPDWNPLVDTTYDGVINGSDLIDIGINWAQTYS